MTATVVRTGTASRPSRQIEEDLRRMGASLGTQRRRRFERDFRFGPRRIRPTGILELIADLARNASFPEEEFERERRQRFEELRIERTTPGFLASERLRRVLFGAHPYAVVAPTEAQVAVVQPRELDEFYRHHYVPARLAADRRRRFRRANAMLDQIEKIFGDWKAPQPEPPTSPEPPQAVRPPRPSRASARQRADASARRQSRHHAPRSRLVSHGAGEFHLRRRLPFAARDEHSRAEGLHLQPAQRHQRASPARLLSPSAPPCATKSSPPRSPKSSTKSTACARSRVTAEELDSARNYLTGVFSLGVATQEGLLGQLSTVYLDRCPRTISKRTASASARSTAETSSRPRAATSIPPTRKSSSSATARKSATRPRSSAQSPNTTPAATSSPRAPST